jgi:hypothetical protein
VVSKIQTPVLITDPEDESFWPGQPEDLFRQLTGEREITYFTREDGANFHCEPMAAPKPNAASSTSSRTSSPQSADSTTTEAVNLN